MDKNSKLIDLFSKKNNGEKISPLYETKNVGIYGIFKEQSKFYIKQKINEQYEYVDKANLCFESYQKAFKKLSNLMIEETISGKALLDEKKYVLKTKSAQPSPTTLSQGEEDVEIDEPMGGEEENSMDSDFNFDASEVEAEQDQMQDLGGEDESDNVGMETMGGDNDEEGDLNVLKQNAGKAAAILKKLEGEEYEQGANYALKTALSSLDLEKLEDGGEKIKNAFDEKFGGDGEPQGDEDDNFEMDMDLEDGEINDNEDKQEDVNENILEEENSDFASTPESSEKYQVIKTYVGDETEYFISPRSNVFNPNEQRYIFNSILSLLLKYNDFEENGDIFSKDELERFIEEREYAVYQSEGYVLLLKKENTGSLIFLLKAKNEQQNGDDILFEYGNEPYADEYPFEDDDELPSQKLGGYQIEDYENFSPKQRQVADIILNGKKYVRFKQMLPEEKYFEYKGKRCIKCKGISSYYGLEKEVLAIACGMPGDQFNQNVYGYNYFFKKVVKNPEMQSVLVEGDIEYENLQKQLIDMQYNPINEDNEGQQPRSVKPLFDKLKRMAKELALGTIYVEYDKVRTNEEPFELQQGARFIFCNAIYEYDGFTFRDIGVLDSTDRVYGYRWFRKNWLRSKDVWEPVQYEPEYEKLEQEYKQLKSKILNQSEGVDNKDEEDLLFDSNLITEEDEDTDFLFDSENLLTEEDLESMYGDDESDESLQEGWPYGNQIKTAYLHLKTIRGRAFDEICSPIVSKLETGGLSSSRISTALKYNAMKYYGYTVPNKIVSQAINYNYESLFTTAGLAKKQTFLAKQKEFRSSDEGTYVFYSEADQFHSEKFDEWFKFRHVFFLDVDLKELAWWLIVEKEELDDEGDLSTDVLNERKRKKKVNKKRKKRHPIYGSYWPYFYGGYGPDAMDMSSGDGGADGGGGGE